MVMLLIPGTLQIDSSELGAFMTGYSYFAVAVYPWLYFLNIFWFHKTIQVVLRFLSSKDEGVIETKTNEKNPQESIASHEEDKIPLM